MAKIKLTKNELKKQKDDLKRFSRYLPTLQLKKQQLQMEIHKIELLREERLQERQEIERKIDTWVHVFGEDVDIENLIHLRRIVIDYGNIAGIDIPIFLSVEFDDISYDIFKMPLWVDTAIEELYKIYKIDAQMRVLNDQIELLREELRITSQRVNLFEKVKIPETRHNIRVIQIYLGDQQTAAVVRGKISKNKIVGE